VTFCFEVGEAAVQYVAQKLKESSSTTPGGGGRDQSGLHGDGRGLLVMGPVGPWSPPLAAGGQTGDNG